MAKTDQPSTGEVDQQKAEQQAKMKALQAAMS